MSKSVRDSKARQRRACAALLCLCLMIAWAGADADADADQATTAQNSLPNSSGAASDSLRLVTLNIAHGRHDAINQLLLGSERIRSNLERVAALLQTIDADVVALQEADGPSRWSGNFDHVDWLANNAGYPWQASAEHAESWLFTYGTAVLSRLPFSETYEHTFQPSPPTFNKGFQLVRLDWRPDGESGAIQGIDVVSVHLDFSRSRVRQQQVEELIDTIMERDSPIALLGDFNSDWLGDDAVVRRLASQFGLSVYRPESSDLGTYPSNGRRLDWVLISNDLEFRSYRVLPDVVSDHLPVVVEIAPRSLTEQVSFDNDRL